MRLVISALLLLVGCAEARYRVKRPFFYEISKGRFEAHILGTLHNGVSMEDLPEEVLHRFREADAFVLEADPKKINQSALDSVYYRGPKGKALKELLDAATYKKLEQFVAQILDPASQKSVLEQFTPLGAYFLVAKKKDAEVIVGKEHATFGNARRLAASMDREFLREAEKLEKPVLTLDEINSEFMECMMSQLYGPQETHIEMLQEVLKPKPVINLNGFFALVENYRAGHIPVSAKATFASCLLEDRNEMWAGKIMSYMSTYKKPFIAVGVLHLEHAETSVFNYLREMGYKVRRLTIESK
jgi:uncharacterized protein YbaP (TraB family)